MKIARNFSLPNRCSASIKLLSAVFTVNQTQQALVLQFGEPKRTIQEPGLAFKLPFIQDVLFYEKRVLSLIPQDAEEVILADQKRLSLSMLMRVIASWTRCCSSKQCATSKARQHVLNQSLIHLCAVCLVVKLWAQS